MNNHAAPPSILLRLLVSHLVVVLACFFAVVLLFDYLFAPGVTMFLVRHPIIIIPVALILIGIAGLAANWASAAIGLPIEFLASRLDAARTEGLAHFTGTRLGSAELADLLDSLVHYLESAHAASADSRLLDVSIDAGLTILSTHDPDPDRARYGHAEWGGRSFTEVFVDESAAAAAAAVLDGHMHAAEAGGEPAFTATWPGSEHAVTWVSLTLRRGDGGLLGLRMLGMTEVPKADESRDEHVDPATISDTDGDAGPSEAGDDERHDEPAPPGEGEGGGESVNP